MKKIKYSKKMLELIKEESILTAIYADKECRDISYKIATNLIKQRDIDLPLRALHDDIWGLMLKTVIKHLKN